MKLTILTLLFSQLLASAVLAAGGDSVGNGGVIWACRDGVGGRNLEAGVLTDLFEAEHEFTWKLIEDPATEPMTIYQNRKVWLQNNLPDMFAALKPRFDYVEQHMTIVDAELISTADFNNAVKPEPAGCPDSAWQPLNIANFREEDQQVLISADLWNSDHIPALHKAGLLFHEAVYYWMRTYFGSTDSDKARKITGAMFSTLAVPQIKDVIASVLGTYPDHPDGKEICLINNSKRNQIYVDYDQTEADATIGVRLRCQDDVDAEWCERDSIQCEDITSDALSHVCWAENSANGKIYTGKGRNQTEAQFNAHLACYFGSIAQKASPQNCPEFTFMECQ